MSTRRRLGLKTLADRADKRNDMPERFICQVCRRQFAKNTPPEVLERHGKSHRRPGASR